MRAQRRHRGTRFANVTHGDAARNQRFWRIDIHLAEIVMITKYQAIPAALALLGVCMFGCASAHDMDGQDNAGDLVGTWQVSVTLQNCQTKAPIGAPFNSLLTFADGGTMTESTANAMFFP